MGTEERKLKRIRKEGGSRVITLTEMIPPDFDYVRVSVIKAVRNSHVIIKIEKAGV